jgi:hypothetical protein
MFSLALQITVSLMFVNNADEHYRLLSFFYFSVNTVLVSLTLKMAYVWRGSWDTHRLPWVTGWISIIILGIQPLVFQFNSIWVRDMAEMFNGHTLSLIAWFNTLVLFNLTLLMTLDVFSALGASACVFERSLRAAAAADVSAEENGASEMQAFELSSLIRSMPPSSSASNKDN